MIKTLSKDLIDGFYKTFDEACQGHAKLLGLKLYAKNIEELRKKFEAVEPKGFFREDNKEYILRNLDKYWKGKGYYDVLSNFYGVIHLVRVEEIYKDFEDLFTGRCCEKADNEAKLIWHLWRFQREVNFYIHLKDFDSIHNEVEKLYFLFEKYHPRKNKLSLN